MFSSGGDQGEAEEAQHVAIGFIQLERSMVPALTKRAPWFSRTKVNIWDPQIGQKALFTREPSLPSFSKVLKLPKIFMSFSEISTTVAFPDPVTFWQSEQ